MGLLFFDGKISAKRNPNSASQLLAQLEENERDFSFHKDWSKAHTAKATTDSMHDFLVDDLVRNGCWTPQSPDFRQPDFPLWGFLK